MAQIVHRSAFNKGNPPPPDLGHFFSDAYRVLDPVWLRDEWGQPEIEDDEFPEHLKLRIADKGDVKKIEAFFNSRRKHTADPENYVRPRPKNHVIDLTNRKRIALIEDHNGDIVSICFAFTHAVKSMPGHESPQNVSEIGTVLSCAKGLGLVSVAISALSLILQEEEGKDHPIIAKVSNDNIAANKLFGNALKWITTEQDSEIHALFKSSAGDTIRSEDNQCTDDKLVIYSRNWYELGDEAENNAKKLLYELRKDGFLEKNDHKILFEFDEEDFNFDFTPKDIEKIPEEEWLPSLILDPDDPNHHRNLTNDGVLSYLEPNDEAQHFTREELEHLGI